jgi:hypothetical protein
MKRSDPLPTANQPVNPLLKRKPLTFPIQRSEDQQIPIDEFRSLSRRRQVWRDQMKAQQTIDEIAAFERRQFGTAAEPPAVEMAPPDRHQLQTIEQFTPTTVGHLFDSAMPPAQVFSRGRTVRTKHRLLNVPAQ